MNPLVPSCQLHSKPVTQYLPRPREGVVLGGGDEGRQGRAIRRQDGQGLHPGRRTFWITTFVRLPRDAGHVMQHGMGLLQTGRASAEQVVEQVIQKADQLLPTVSSRSVFWHQATLVTDDHLR